jgi:hypothetical protein
MSIGSPQKQGAPVGPTPGAPVRAPTPPSRSIWTIVIASLVVGGLVGYLLGWNLAPTETETVTQAVTETVAPAAYTVSDEVEALVTFDGTSCTYAGPAELEARTWVEFTYRATVDSGLVVWLVEPGITYEQVMRAVETRAGDDPPPWLVGYQTSAKVGAREQWLRMSIPAGMHVVSCVTPPETTNDVFASTIIRVLPA